MKRKQILFSLLIIFSLTFQKVRGQWTSVWTENFNNLTRGSAYNNGVTGYWNNNANPPQNSQVSGTFEATASNGIVAGTTQVPADAAGGRFLMFWTQNSVTIPTMPLPAANIFFKKTVTVISGRTYRISFRFAALGTVPSLADRANVTFKAATAGNASPFYTSATTVADVNGWKNLEFEFKVPTGVSTIDLTWENSTKSTAGNDFGVDDLLLEVAIDSDGEGVPDIYDLDDDNDGVLDINENYNCLTNVATSIAPSPSATVNYSGLDIAYTASGNSVNTFTAPGIGFAGLEPRQGATITYTFSLPVNNLKMWFTDLDNREYLKINYYDEYNNRITNLNPYITANIGSSKNISFDGNYGLLIDPTLNTGSASESQYVEVTTGLVIKRVEVTFNSVRADGTAYINATQTPEVYIKGLCFYGDTDGDEIPDRLDLDSDNDGCVDALEGGENVTNAQLVTAAVGLDVGFGSLAAKQNLGGTVNATGVPNVVNTGGAADTGSATQGTIGQPIGSSLDPLINPCCTNPPNLNPATDFTKTGISTLAGFGTTGNGWPQNIPNGFIAIESQNKGFVITRVLSANDIPTADRVEGMLVYDINDACVKLYNGAYWKCLEKDCGIPTN